MLSYLYPFEDEGISTGGAGNQVHPGTSKSILVHQCPCSQNFSFICKHLITNKLFNSTNCIQEVFVFGNHLCKYLFKLSLFTFQQRSNPLHLAEILNCCSITQFFNNVFIESFLRKEMKDGEKKTSPNSIISQQLQ